MYSTVKLHDTTAINQSVDEFISDHIDTRPQKIRKKLLQKITNYKWTQLGLCGYKESNCTPLTQHSFQQCYVICKLRLNFFEAIRYVHSQNSCCPSDGRSVCAALLTKANLPNASSSWGGGQQLDSPTGTGRLYSQYVATSLFGMDGHRFSLLQGSTLIMLFILSCSYFSRTSNVNGTVHCTA